MLVEMRRMPASLAIATSRDLHCCMACPNYPLPDVICEGAAGLHICHTLKLRLCPCLPKMLDVAASQCQRGWAGWVVGAVVFLCGAVWRPTYHGGAD
ncbi:hypothetical protein HaLaN_11197, partial [Haematococcus lacustris]